MTERLARFCQRYRWIVVVGWLVLAVGGVLSSGPVMDSIAQPKSPENVEAFKADSVIKEESDRGEYVFGLLDGVDPKDPKVRSAVKAASADLAEVAGVRSVQSPYSSYSASDGLVARDGKALLIRVELKKLDDDAEKTAVDAVSDRIDKLDEAVPGAAVKVGGTPVRNVEAGESVGKDLARSELISLPLTLIVLVFVFGGLIAAGLPLLGMIATLLTSFILLLGFSRFVNLDANVVTIVALLSLGLSIDYALLLVARYREELAAGHEPEEALPRAWGSAGRTIVFSALTVAASLCGLLVFDVSGLQAVGAAGIAAVIGAMVTSLTLTAAVLGFARRRVRPSKRALGARTPGAEDENGGFARLAGAVQKRPVPVLIASVAVLLLMGAPMLGANLKMNGASVLPADLPSVQVDTVLKERFGKDGDPAVVVVARTDPAALNAWAKRHREDPGVVAVSQAKPISERLAVVDFTIEGASNGTVAKEQVDRLRADQPVAESWVTGPTAQLVDALGQLEDGLPWAALVMILSMGVLLFLMTGSLMIPLKALLMNVVSLGAAFGVLVAVVQKGWLASALGITVIGGVDPFILVFVLAFAFGLSMDYEVFLLSRVSELVESGTPNDTAVRLGLQRSGRIITSAALLMIIAFAAFVTADFGAIQQIGLGLSVAIFVDATIVRCLLVPATMTLMGRWNWWAPAPLKRFHARFGLREGGRPAPTPEKDTDKAPEEGPEKAVPIDV
ncbi:MMPL family transporter [Streptomyces palmae]|uniref:MMPL family transporter n=1 Tax=Streptomyces palmae TaxID=1701085 RepID=UPI001432B6C4|nr:MMPL family transporter [Streptomyces palmae]